MFALIAITRTRRPERSTYLLLAHGSVYTIRFRRGACVQTVSDADPTASSDSACGAGYLMRGP